MRWDRSQGRPEPIRALNRIRHQENGEPLVDLRQAAPSVRIGREQTIPYCRATVAAMVERAAQSLPEGVYLAVTDAWRPIARQERIYNWMFACAQEAFPSATYASLRRRTNRWAAPYDQSAPPGHCTGAALDVMLQDEAGEWLDVSSPYSRFQAAPTFSMGLDAAAWRNRMVLYEAMTGAGFSNCRDEWWHYSYGDAAWAVRLGLDACHYGLAQLPEELYAEKERVWIEAMKDRPNPFLEKASAS